MQKLSLYCTTGLLVLLISGLYSCKRVNGTNNDQTIETPYSLYFSDTSGALYNTTDGKSGIKVVFGPDGTPARALVTDGLNILWAKRDLLISQNNGRNFNHSYDSVSSFPDATCESHLLDLNQSMLYNIPAWQRTYIMSNANPGDNTSTNYLGLAHNDTFGFRGHWSLDIYYDTDRIGVVPIYMTSLTQLANGVLCGLALDDDGQLRNLYKTCHDDAQCRWKECTSNPDLLPLLPQFYTNGNPLGYGTALQGYFSLGHFNNRLIAIDNKCDNGAWYSDDTGRNWTTYAGLPSGVALTCIASPFEQTCLIGTDGAGLYALNLQTQTFEPNNNGLGKHIKVRNIASKENVFKNGGSQRYIYLATDQGLYQSTDGGHNWVLTYAGNFITVY